MYWLAQARDGFARIGTANLFAKALGNLGWCYYRLGDYDKALVQLRAAEERFRKIQNRYEQQIWVGNIGGVLRDRGDFSGAVDATTRALAIARELREQYWTGWWLYNLALDSIHLRDFDSAE